MRSRTSASRCSSSNSVDDGLEEALDENADRVLATDAAGAHVEDQVLIDLADRAAVRGGDVVDLDDQRRDRVDLGVFAEHQRVRLQVGVAVLVAFSMISIRPS